MSPSHTTPPSFPTSQGMNDKRWNYSDLGQGNSRLSHRAYSVSQKMQASVLSKFEGESKWASKYLTNIKIAKQTTLNPDSYEFII